MKHLHRSVGVAAAPCIMITLLITSVEAVVYWTLGYFEKKHTKYNVLENLPAMTIDDLLEVMGRMMDYLKDDREDPHVTATMGDQQQGFFNEREIAHMEDVQVLSLKVMSIRRIYLTAAALLLIFMAAVKGRMRQTLPPSLCIGCGLFLELITALALIISIDFSKYSIVFHHVFFINSLWILNPATDIFINIVPEGFLMDIAARIASLFGVLSLILFGFCLFLTTKNRKKAV